MNKFYNLLKNLWAKIRFRYNYWVISDSAGEASFAVIGNATGRNPYCRTYLGQRDLPDVKVNWYPGGTKIVQKLLLKHGMVVLADVQVPADLAEQILLVPNFLSLAIKLPADLSAYMKSISASMRSNIRLLEKKNFTWRISNDVAWVSTFYHQYYQPTMLQSHGDEAYIYSESGIREIFQKDGAEFLLIYDEEDCVGAALCRKTDQIYHIVNLGWRNGDAELRKKGVPSAFFWYSICRSFEIGCNMINCGGSPPYLENGVTRFKLPWGATYCQELSVYGERGLLLNPADPCCYQFLSNNSIIAYGVDKELIVLSNKRPEECNLRDAFLKDISAWYLLLPEEDSNQETTSLQHLPSSLRSWYKYITLTIKQVRHIDRREDISLPVAHADY